MAVYAGMLPVGMGCAWAVKKLLDMNFDHHYKVRKQLYADDWARYKAQWVDEKQTTPSKKDKVQ